ncbi:hypothetical protein [Natrarchaeobaculum sulfurireducens]|uniref:Uncharacterized protein n=1 Tax=Natrarchaeobaculum sulfurireducens TaxID=2044521 RepID=A0A346PL20_9EURY|nr:hypothetical protein [Natrarchaeobaculum sulfurireducens]AXR76538.1 hypothetical protein AArc1_0194 [Natrarchaeobaculum sulfurireducens]AXR80215.1 hypothetical protein AArcMg_0192 [Natrarchaeobaculum sulfurireducens]
MTDDADTPTEDEHATSDDDGEVEIEITRGRVDDRRVPTDNHHSSARDSGERHDQEAATEAASRDLADELGRIDVMTTPEGYVEGRVIDVCAVDETTVRLTVALPHGESTAFTLEKPIPWSREFLLARIVEDVGYDAASIDHVVGDAVYVQRTDREADDDPWWDSSVQTASDALLSSLSAGRYRLERDTSPEWRLVDPLERPDATSEAGEEMTADLVGAGLVLVGTIVAAAGAVVGATGGLVLSAAVVGYALVGLLLVLFGLGVLVREAN